MQFLLKITATFFCRYRKDLESSGMVKEGTLKNHSFIKAMKILTKIVKINFFRTLEFKQRLATIWKVFIQEKCLNLWKNQQALWYFEHSLFLFPFPSPSPQFQCSLENQQPTIIVKSAALQPLERLEQVRALLNSHSQRTVIT